MSDYQSRFLFHGEAVAFGARLDGLLDVQAAAVLPSVGGRALASASGYTLGGGLVRFDVAGSEVIGEVLPDGTRVTTATTWVKGLRVGNILSADGLLVTLESRHQPPAGATLLVEPPSEPTFPKLTLEIDGLSAMLGTCKEDPAAVAFVENKATFSALMANPITIPPAIEDLVYHGKPAPLSVASGPTALVASPAGNVSVFLVRPPSSLGKATPSVGGFTLSVDDTDYRFYLGEYVISRGRRRFSLLRLELSEREGGMSANGPRGSLAMLELSINGVSHP